ncbi:MAG: amidase family protein, partial [Alphaproteobacteria bacterium]|nr:amidase family protein [Alphaproteobacteria bacterium]
FMQAARVRRMLADSFNSAFEQCDLILCPSSAGTAMPLDSDLSPLEYYALDLFTVAMNLVGVPACSVPAGLAQNGLPLGLQVIGRRFDDMRVLQLAKHIEIASNIDNRPTTIMGK